MRAWVAQAALGGVALVTSATLFLVELVDLLTDPQLSHDHCGGVMTAFLVSMALFGLSITVLLEVRAMRRRRSRTGRV